jgi:hypothetical protein
VNQLRDQTCELCEAARLTEWFYEDDVCWIAECDACAVPMVVWREHDAHPPRDLKATLHARLSAVVEQHFGYEHYVDDNLRSIPTHYHAHARPKGGFFGHGVRRRSASPPPSLWNASAP